MELDRRAMLAAGVALAGTAALPRSAGAAPPRSFPQSFLWGAATAGHQVEGNNTNSDVWFAEHVTPTSYAEPSGDAANSFELWRTDLELVKALSLNAYRFSLEWARIEPEPGLFSVAMLDHYQRIIETARSMGIRPVVTFNHFSTPVWFAARGGWTNPDAPGLFARYCDRAARHLAGGIDHATTLNEPNLAGLLQELLPPGLVATEKATAEAAAKKLGVPSFFAGNSLYLPDAAVVRAHLQAAHRAGRAAIKAVRPDLPVGVSLAMLDDQAVGENSLRDQKRASFYDSWLELARGDDFLGVQNYERARWTATGKLPPPPGSRLNTMGSEVWPPSLAGAVRYAHQKAKVPIIVTEHGVGTDDDTLRAWLIPAALSELRIAMEEGVPVKGYLHWSLVDNFEWGFGYRIRFGLHSLDRKTFKRTPKPSAAVYAAIARANAA